MSLVYKLFLLLFITATTGCSLSTTDSARALSTITDTYYSPNLDLCFWELINLICLIAGAHVFLRLRGQIRSERDIPSEMMSHSSEIVAAHAERNSNISLEETSRSLVIKNSLSLLFNSGLNPFIIAIILIYGILYFPVTFFTVITGYPYRALLTLVCGIPVACITFYRPVTRMLFDR